VAKTSPPARVTTSTRFIVKGIDLPILALGTNQDYPNFLLQQSPEGTPASKLYAIQPGGYWQWGNTGVGGVNHGAPDAGVNILISTSTRLVFSLPSANLGRTSAYAGTAGTGPWEVWLSDQPIVPGESTTLSVIVR
jgi:hypothetical protein